MIWAGSEAPCGAAACQISSSLAEGGPQPFSIAHTKLCRLEREGRRGGRRVCLRRRPHAANDARRTQSAPTLFVS